MRARSARPPRAPVPASRAPESEARTVPPLERPSWKLRRRRRCGGAVRSVPGRRCSLARAPLSAPCSGLDHGEPERGGGPRAATGRGKFASRPYARASAARPPRRSRPQRRAGGAGPARSFRARNPRSVTAGRPGLRAGVILRPAGALGWPHGVPLAGGPPVSGSPGGTSRTCRQRSWSVSVSWESVLGWGWDRSACRRFTSEQGEPQPASCVPTGNGVLGVMLLGGIMEKSGGKRGEAVVW